MRYGLKHISCTTAASSSFVYRNLRKALLNMVSTRSKAKPKPVLVSVPGKPKATAAKQVISKFISKAAPKDLPIHAFATANDFESFLDEHHQTLTGLWLKLARKSSGIPSIKTMEAVEVALCFGWINGQGKPFDEKYYLSRYTPRRPKSLWSELNVDLVAKLTEEGRMRPAGIRAVDAAKADGIWERAYARPSDMIVPEDLRLALEESETAKAFFEGLGKGRRYAVLHKVYTASPAARQSRVKAVVDGLAVGKVPGENRRKA